MKEYHNNPQATAEVIKDGWLHTGDLGSIDKDGYLRVRLTEIIPLLINATNEQQKELDKNKEMLQVMKGSLDLRVANLEERVEKLESENAMLKSYLCSQDPNAPFCK